MQVGINVKCMHTNFGGHGLSSFGDKIRFQINFGQISLSNHGHAPTQLILPLEIINFALLLN